MSDLPTEEQIVTWVENAQISPNGQHLVSLSDFTSFFGHLRGSLLILLTSMARDRKIAFQCYDSWRQREAKGEFVEGRDFIHINEWQQGMGFICTL